MSVVVGDGMTYWVGMEITFNGYQSKGVPDGLYVVDAVLHFQNQHGARLVKLDIHAA